MYDLDEIREKERRLTSRIDDIFSGRCKEKSERYDRMMTKRWEDRLYIYRLLARERKIKRWWQSRQWTVYDFKSLINWFVYAFDMLLVEKKKANNYPQSKAKFN